MLTKGVKVDAKVGEDTLDGADLAVLNELRKGNNFNPSAHT